MQHDAQRPLRRHPHAGPVPEAAWARTQLLVPGRVAIFDAERADGPDGGRTMDEPDLAEQDGTVALTTVVDLAHERYATHPLFPKGRVRDDRTFTEVDLEARCEVERVPGRSPRRIMRWRAAPDDAGTGQHGR